MTALLISLLVAATGPQEPAPLPANPDGVEQTPWDPLVLERCTQELKMAGVDEYTFLKRRPVERLASRKHGDMYCYVPQSLHYRRGPGDFSYSSYVLVNCRMAVAMARFEEIAQRVAKQVLGKKARISHVEILGAYNCRRLRGRPDYQSQHSFGNAVDIRAFRVRGFGRISLEEHWWNHKTAWSRKASRFLYMLVTELRRENVFTNVLTPNYDQSHENHLHLDKAPHKDVRLLDAFELASPTPGDDKPVVPEKPSPRLIAEPTWELPEPSLADER